MHSYSSIYNLGHRYVSTLFDSDVLIEEKVDGSQFSFGVFNGELMLRSKGASLHLPVDNNLFKDACEYVVSVQDKLVPNATYRGEVLWRPKHNSLTYNRVPKHNVVLFDIDLDECKYVSYDEKVSMAANLDLEVVPKIFSGKVGSIEQLREFFARESFLGGPKIEGFVIKNYAQYGPDKKVLMGKWVSEAFKEVHSKEWKKNNPGYNDVVQNIVLMYRTPARWNKAIQHLKEQGILQDSPKDIGVLMKEINVDVLKEEEEQIKDELFKQAWKTISRGLTAGFPEYYKDVLAQKQFGGKGE